MFTSVFLGALLFLQTRSTRISDYQSQPISCLAANFRCYNNQACRIQLDAVVNVCQKLVDVCPQDCTDILLALQKNQYFYKCTCDQRMPKYHSCRQVQNKVHHNPCSNTPALLAKDSTYPVNMVPVTDHFTDYEDLYSLETMDEGGCIRARKLCLRNSECETALNTYRLKCRESKKRNRCTARDSEGCFSAIETMQELSADIFTCRCDQRNNDSRSRCQRIQSRLANNTCLVEVPYLIFSRQTQEMTYDGLLSISKSSDQSNSHEYSTCRQSFRECHQDAICNSYITGLLSACEWTETESSCNKEVCLQAIRDFYSFTSPRKAQALAFCKCVESDKNCKLIQGSLRPSCSLVETPPPNCVDVIDRCRKNPECSLRLSNYKKYCGFESGVSLCPEGPAMCRNAMISVMGTILTTNCTCLFTNHSHNKRCLEDRWILQGQNPCQRDATDHFHIDSESSTTELVIMDSTQSNQKQDCKRLVNGKFPGYYSTPHTVRIYNDSECSKLCSCQSDGVLQCVHLPCSKHLSCSQNNIVYVDGSSFSHSSRGQCRCIRSEMVCARPNQQLRSPGLFLHIGFSLNDRNLVEEHSKVRFTHNSVAVKLATILNGDSAKHFCDLTLYKHHTSNFILRVEVSPFIAKQDGRPDCVSSAKQLSYMVNSRHPIIATDAELSIIKVAQLENISIYTDQRSQHNPIVTSDLIDADDNSLWNSNVTSGNSRVIKHITIGFSSISSISTPNKVLMGTMSIIIWVIFIHDCTHIKT